MEAISVLLFVLCVAILMAFNALRTGLSFDQMFNSIPKGNRIFTIGAALVAIALILYSCYELYAAFFA